MRRWQIGPSTVWGEDGIIFRSMEPGSVMRLEHATALVEKIQELGGEDPVPVVSIQARAANADAAARRYMSSPEVARRFSAWAMVTGSQAMVVIATFYLRFSRPPYPARIFHELDRAVAWAKQYVRA